MTGALAYLTWRSTANRFKVRLRRMREPRYLAGALVGALYFYAVLFRRRGGRPSSGGQTGLIGLLVAHQGAVEIAGAVVLLLLTALAWFLPSSGKPALAFSRADVQWLFPAPIARRDLVRYRVLRSQIGPTIGSALMTVFFRPSSLVTGWTFFAGMFLVMTTVNLHLTGAALRRESLKEHGAAGLARQWVPIAVIAGALGVVATAVARDWSRLTSLRTFSAIVGEAERVLGSGAAGAVLSPFRAVARMPVSGSASAFLHALPLALVILAVNYLWIERSDVAFEEASADFAERRNAADPRGRRITPKVRAATTPFTLGLTGRPEIALVWKNLILLGRYASLKLLVRLVPLVILLGLSFSASTRTNGVAHAMTIACLVSVGIATVLGPQIIRNDLRRDLANLAVIRTWPLAGATVVRGEILAPAAVLTVMAWLLLLSATVVSSNMALADPLRFARRVDYAVAAACLAPGLILVQLIVHNTIAIAFPAWAQISANRTRGVDVMGQRLLMLAGLLIVLVVAVLPAAAVGGAVALAMYRLTGTVAVVVPGALAGVVLLLECLVATEAAGALLDRTDVSALDLGE